MGYNAIAKNTFVLQMLPPASQICLIPRNSSLIRTYSSSRSSNVIDRLAISH